MMFTPKSYRAFAALVGLFLLVAQVVAVPPRVRRPPPSQSVGAAHIDRINRGMASHRDSFKAQMKAKKEHAKVANANFNLAHLHEHYAEGLPQAERDRHRQVAGQHRTTAQSHLNDAQSHLAAAENHRNAKGSTFVAIYNADRNGRESRKKAKSLKQHAKMLRSAMDAAREHRIAYSTHHDTANLGGRLGRLDDFNYHRDKAKSHANKASEHSNFAIDNATPEPMALSVKQQKKLTDQSAADARLSNAVGQLAMHKMANTPASRHPLAQR